MRTTREPQWTPRQREVLDLLVRGNTNSQIADRLGISLDGAKWHVSEIITRLGVDSRDEAAEYWRHRNGLRMRFSRVASLFFGSGALKWGAATVLVTGVVVASAMVIVALREAGGDQTEPTAGNPPEGDVTDPNAQPNQPDPAPADPQTSPLPTGEVIAGVPVSAVTLTQPGSLPVPMSVVIEKGCFQCDGPASGFERVTLDSQGQLVTERLYKPDSGYISHSYWDAANRTHYLSVCSRGYCGGVGQITADAQTTILRSDDGGVTWQAVQTFDGDVGLGGPTQEGFLLNRSTFANGTTDYRFQVLGTDAVLRPPSGTEPEFYYGRGTLAGWRKSGTNEILNLDGSSLVTLPDVGDAEAGGRASIASVLGDEVLIVWSERSIASYVGLMRNGTLATIFKYKPAVGDAFLNFGTWLTRSVVFGNAWVTPSKVDPASSSTQSGLHPVMLDLQTGQMTVLELYGPEFSDNYLIQRNYIREVESGPFLRVTGAGDCLNVREQASTGAKSLGCFADNVLLKDLAQEEAAGGVTWKKVQAPGGQQGWASAEFLR